MFSETSLKENVLSSEMATSGGTQKYLAADKKIGLVLLRRNTKKNKRAYI